MGGEAAGSAIAGVFLAAAALVWLLGLQEGADLQALRNEAQALFEEKQTSAAVDAFAGVIDAPAATAADWRNLALARYELGTDATTDVDILDALARADDLAPGHAATSFLRGLTYGRRGRDVEAAAEYQAAASIDETDPATLYNWASTLHNLGRVDEALPLYERVAAMGFDVAQQFFVSSLYRTGRALMFSDGIEVARPYLERYQEFQGRLSQAQRAATALEAGRHKGVVVPRVNLVAATPGTFDEIRFVAGTAIDAAGLESPHRLTVHDFGAGPLLVQTDSAATDSVGTGGDGPVVLRLGSHDGPAAIGDHNRDGRADVVVLGRDETELLDQVVDDAGSPTFVRVAATGMPLVPTATAADWVDADHDGDLDLMVTSAEPGMGFRWIANHGGNAFLDVTATAGLGGEAARSFAWADFDDDNDVDFYVVLANGQGRLYSNARSGQFEEIAAAVGAAGPGSVETVLAEDIDNDGWFDVILGGANGVVTLTNNGDGTFRESVIHTEALGELFAVDLNNDGWLDLVDSDGTALVNAGNGTFIAQSSLGSVSGRVVGIADANADGALDALVLNGTEVRWHTQEAPVGNWLRLGLTGVKSNLEGIGAVVEAKAGGLYQRRMQRGRWTHFGLGQATVADVARITWPNGIIQNEIAVEANSALGPVGEVERLEGSCPLLYTWNGTEWVFINEVLGVAPLGMPLATDVIHPADFDEYVPIPGEALRPRDGILEVRLTDELREAAYLDAVRLVAIDRPIGVEVVPDERFSAPPHPEFGIFAVTERLAVEARDHEGRDWTTELATVDGDWARPFAPFLYEGLATEHSIELDLPQATPGETVRLFLTGWVYWATGSINLQVDQDPRVLFAPVALEVPDGQGGWRIAVADIGLPNAKNSTLVLDVGKYLVAGDPRVRLSTTMRLYWDAASYAVGSASTLYRPTGDWAGAWGVPHAGSLELTAAGLATQAAPRLHVLEPQEADIRWRGFSTLLRGNDGFETFDYGAVTAGSNWNQHRGTYTRYGPVGDLLRIADDELVLAGTGDEVSVRFADTLPPVADGWRRDWLLYLNGWVKDGDPNTLGGERVEPLPTHSMGLYPPARASADDWTPESATDDWRAVYNTRSAREVNAPLRPRR